MTKGRRLLVLRRNRQRVTRFRYSTDKSYAVVVPDTGMTIIGAGVSTCAPLVSPN